MWILNAASPHVILMVVAWFATHSSDKPAGGGVAVARVPQLSVGAL